MTTPFYIRLQMEEKIPKNKIPNPKKGRNYE
jgi:hypothetical protein